MKKILLSAIAIGSMATLADAAIDCNMRLSDGSAIKGELLTEKLVGETIFAPSLELAPDIVKSVTLRGTNGVAALELANSDKLTMTLATEAFRLKSIIGVFDVPRANVKALTLTTRPDGAKCCGGDGLVYWCTFESEADVENPAVGPQGKYICGDFVPGKVGNAISFPAYRTGVLVNIPQGVIRERGCIEFWAKLVDGKYSFIDGGDPYLFDCVSGSEFFHIEFNANNGGGNSGLCSGMPGAGCTSERGYRGSMPYDVVFTHGSAREWHHYALVWDVDGLNVNGEMVYSALMLDGRFVSKVHWPSYAGPVNEQFSINAEREFILSIPVMTRRARTHSKAPVAIDEFKIWNFAKTTFDL